ncbi:double-strand-break repair protein rad21-like protein 1 isoform 3-T6 [Anomaloglossus baeobatrachus]|uniref:double-strand-break repair protein rad21-like protein 1 isoform X1 n=1 Tax=Anomaloglossus baeobatrachus TaxID=238106 RepID=UPI003F50055A
MFYTYLLLGKRGILSKVWIAAHWEKKLTKAHIFECNLETAIQSIMAPKVIIALRTSGHLLLGVVRIYHRKAKYLLADCNEALLNMKLTFRPGALDLTENNQEASYNAITLTEEFPDFDMQLPDLNLIDVVDHFTLNQSRVEDITIPEHSDGALTLHGGFGDGLDVFRHGSSSDLSFEVSTQSVLPEQSSAFVPDDTRDIFANDLFGDEGATSDFFDNNQLFDESYELSVNKDIGQDVMLPPEDQPPEDYLDETHELPLEDADVANTTTLVPDEEIGFVLEPVDDSVLEKKKRSKRKRKLMVDDLKEIPSIRMQEQLRDTSDIVTTLEIAPPTRQLMELKEKGSVQWLLSHPCQPIINADLLPLFSQTQKADSPRFVQEEAADPPTETPLHQQEEMDLPQPEVTKESDFSSSIAEEPLCTELDSKDYNQTPSDTDRSAQEEYVNGLLDNSSRSEDEEYGGPTQHDQSNDEQKWNKQTQNLLHGLRKLNQSGEDFFSFQKFCRNNKRKEVSNKFYSFLVLKKQAAIVMTQSAPYADITAIPGPRFHTL